MSGGSGTRKPGAQDQDAAAGAPTPGAPRLMTQGPGAQETGAADAETGGAGTEGPAPVDGARPAAGMAGLDGAAGGTRPAVGLAGPDAAAWGAAGATVARAAADGSAGGAAGGSGLDAAAAALAAHGLAVIGALHPGPQDGAPAGTGTLLLAGPAGPAMWAAFAASPEAADGAAHPLDRWSRRVLAQAAQRLDAQGLGASALFPFDGPPWPPFFRWALAGAPVWPSKLGMLVHAELGLWVSFRGALALTARLDLPARTAAARPCDPCPAPCRAACPVGAFTDAGYDAGACRAHLDRPEGAPCRAQGCLARRACPVGAALAPTAAQGAFHLAAFRAA